MNKIETINAQDINADGPVRHPVLPEGFIERVIAFKSALGEMDFATLEETVGNFQQDRHPERELKIWEDMATVYKEFVGTHSELNLEAKKEVFLAVLDASTGRINAEERKHLSSEEVENLKIRWAEEYGK